MLIMSHSVGLSDIIYYTYRIISSQKNNDEEQQWNVRTVVCHAVVQTDMGALNLKNNTKLSFHSIYWWN